MIFDFHVPFQFIGICWAYCVLCSTFVSFLIHTDTRSTPTLIRQPRIIGSTTTNIPQTDCSRSRTLTLIVLVLHVLLYFITVFSMKLHFRDTYLYFCNVSKKLLAFIFARVSLFYTLFSFLLYIVLSASASLCLYRYTQLTHVKLSTNLLHVLRLSKQ